MTMSDFQDIFVKWKNESTNNVFVANSYIRELECICLFLQNKPEKNIPGPMKLVIYNAGWKRVEETVPCSSSEFRTFSMFYKFITKIKY